MFIAKDKERITKGWDYLKRETLFMIGASERLFMEFGGF